MAFPGSANGNQAIEVSKNVTGYTSDLDPADTYRLKVTCLDSDGQPVSVTPSVEVSVAAGETQTVDAASGSTCSVTEPDPGDAFAEYSQDVAITHALEDTFALSVPNDFPTPMRDPTVSKHVTGRLEST